MAKSTTFVFEEFKKDYFVAWNITSQCANTGNVEITSGNKTLVNAQKVSGSSSFQLLSQGSATIDADSVSIKVTINEAKIELENSKTGNIIMDSAGKKVGCVYDICIEDSEDKDFNDIYINIVGWERKG